MAGTKNKAKINSSNGATGKTVRRDSTNSKFSDKAESKNSMSEADKLTLRAWKKTFENHKKAA